MNVEIGAEAALFPEKEYINGIFVTVYLFYLLELGVVPIPKSFLVISWCSHRTALQKRNPDPDP
jgi:hypothetical protein